MKILNDFSGSLKKALSFCSEVGLPGAVTWIFLTSIRPASESVMIPDPMSPSRSPSSSSSISSSSSSKSASSSVALACLTEGIDAPS